MAKTKATLKSRKTRGKAGGTSRRKHGVAVLKARQDLSFPIVMVGASAGGLEALTALLKALPANTGLAFVLIQHLEPTHPSALTKILSQSTQMPIREVVDGVVVESNDIYVIPPNKSMTVRQGILWLAAREKTSVSHRPIDTFGVALSEDREAAAIGVVLSGTGSDGMLGLKAIKAAGGITFAQEPKTAQWPDMPLSAISAGAVDFVLPPKLIADELTRLGSHPNVMASTQLPEGGDLENICIVLRSHTGVDFRLYKQATISRRIARRMAMQKIDSLEKYVRFLKHNPAETEILSNDIFIHVTGFLRDPECFEALRKRVFPRLQLKRTPGDTIRIWVPGCSTGEEVYSVAILLLEDLGKRESSLKIKVFGTDVSESAIEHARAGVYSESAVNGLSPARLKRCFSKVDSGYLVDQAIRNICVFAQHDLATDPPFSKLDLISCRNVLIYMGPALQERTLSIFQYALKPLGSLFLGKAESISACADAFGVEDRTHRIFIRKPGSSSHHFHLPGGYQDSDARPSGNGGPAGSVHDIQNEAMQVLIERYLPPAFIVDPDLHIIHFQGDTTPFLAAATGRPSFHILKIVRSELIVALRTAIYAAKKERVTIRSECVNLDHKGQHHDVRLEVTPVQRRNSSKCDFLVILKEMDLDGPTLQDESYSPDSMGPDGKPGRKKVSTLQRELASTREYLKSLIGEHETVQAELATMHEQTLSSNEELQSANEELETTKEELQSSNQELTTLNEELQRGNTALATTSSDLNNLLVAVNIPILVLDSAYRIRRFTPDAAIAFNLIAADLGRPFSNIASNLDVSDWGSLFAETVRGDRIEREVRDGKGHWYSLRMQPYRVGGDKIDGVIVYLLDTSLIKAALEVAEKSRQEVRSLAANLLTAQEQERRRVSQELHDGLCQQLASLAFEVGGMAAELPVPDVAQPRLRELQARLVKVSEDARHIAYQLHPSALDDLGLGAALEALCKEFSGREGTVVKLVHGDIQDSLPMEIASCLYRVCQECLSNSARHSRAKRVIVTLAEKEGSIALSIKDNGVGFHLEAIRSNAGLGMIGMNERARMVNGKLSI